MLVDTAPTTRHEHENSRTQQLIEETTGQDTSWRSFNDISSSPFGGSLLAEDTRPPIPQWFQPSWISIPFVEKRISDEESRMLTAVLIQEVTTAFDSWPIDTYAFAMTHAD